MGVQEVALDLEPRLLDQTVGRSIGAYSGRIEATFARNNDAESDQPTRSASVAAGIVGVFSNSSRWEQTH